MSKKILFSLMAIILAVGLVGAGAFAYFSDTETSTGNTFTAGTLDLLVTTSGACSDVGKITVNEQGDGLNDSVVFANLAPGDSGSITWTITNTGTLPGMVMIHRTLSNDVDGVDTEPELLVDLTPGAAGELDNNMWLISTVTIDGVSTFVYEGNPWYANWMSLEATYGPEQFDNLPKLLPANSVLVVTYNWSIPTTVDDVIQGDTFTLNLEMTLDQVGAS